MREAAVVLGVGDFVIQWWVPDNRTSVAVPDSSSLWDVIWESRDIFVGTAHTHPGGGVPSPSHEDLTTWEATEAALGRRLCWYIASSDALASFRWCGPERYDYRRTVVELPKPWLSELRGRSEMGVVCTFPACWKLRDGRYGDHCEDHRREPHDCACAAGAPWHTDERCAGYRG